MTATRPPYALLKTYLLYVGASGLSFLIITVLNALTIFEISQFPSILLNLDILGACLAVMALAATLIAGPYILFTTLSARFFGWPVMVEYSFGLGILGMTPTIVLLFVTLLFVRAERWWLTGAEWMAITTAVAIIGTALVLTLYGEQA